jgi:xanthine dehydrogenase iron-sulfur cluster and FAD-binding subunit A
MKNKLIILSLILSIFTTSCSTRKVAKSETKETTEVKAIDTTKTVTNTQKFERSVDTSTVSEIEIVPIDITKPMVINGKTYTNAILKRKVTKLNKVVEIDTKVDQIQQKGVNKAIKTERTIKEKQTERKSGFNWWWLLFLLIPIAYLKYKKYI